MTDTTIADKLGISEGFVVWIIGQTVEETALLDPLPEGAEVLEERDEDDPEHIDAAILFVDGRTELIEDLDEVIPRLGSIPVVWISFPHGGRADVDEESIGELVTDYGWQPVERSTLDDTWAAVRILQS